jgi:hypothetical protein
MLVRDVDPAREAVQAVVDVDHRLAVHSGLRYPFTGQSKTTLVGLHDSRGWAMAGAAEASARRGERRALQVA